MAANLESIEQAIKDLGTSIIVSCPKESLKIPGSGSATELDSGDTVGNVFMIPVPKSGEIRSATFWDLDDEGIQIDVFIFKAPIVDVAVDAAYAPTDVESLQYLTKLSFVSFDDQGAFQTSELTNIGKAYSVPNGKLYLQAVTRGTSNIAAGSEPRFQLQIQSFDPNFKES